MYQSKDYWENRLRQSMNLEGVGCLGRGGQYNTYLYRSKVRAFEKGLRKIGIRNVSGKSILDLGAGIGFWINYFLNHGAGTCMGVDIAEVAVEYLSNTFASEKTAFFCSDLSNPRLPMIIGRRFEIVTAIDVLYHIISDELLEKAIENVRQLTEDQGWFIFTDVIGLLPGQASSQSHVKWRPKAYWKPLLAANGFQIRVQVPMYMFLHAAITGPLFLRRCVNFVHYRVTPRISEKPFWGKAYLSFLSALDRLCTAMGGTSLVMVFAQRVRE